MALAARRLARRRSFAQHRDISTLILLRHGTSEWNGAEARFSGWCDIPLTVRGRVEAVAAGQLLRARWASQRRIAPRSRSPELQRAHETCELALASMAGHCQHTWSTDRIQRDRRLNERHYGAAGPLQGRPDLVAGFGIPKLREWKRSMHGTPPARTASVACLDCFEDLVKPALFESANRAVLLVAHSNTLRALMAAIDEVPDDDVPALHVPNSVPILYRFGVDRRAPVSVKLCKGSGTQSHARWMLTPENHAQVHDALESGGLLTRAFLNPSA
ncbi:heme binding protein [Aureococcus anophagefferens]|uniref:phosphoglycerate mutase (2,3-diphosphoglycerate-dependent) n=1 Tax=Aureococcus anophagefferens TaxID=44056 RepID=A0ABR1GB04_AURAN